MGKMGRPKTNLEDIAVDGWEYLDAMIRWADEEVCARAMGISADTLYRRIKERHGVTFAEYKKQKKEIMKINLFSKQYQVAMDGNVSMLIWLGKQHLGQSDKQEQKVEKVQVEPLEKYIERIRKEDKDGDTQRS